MIKKYVINLLLALVVVWYADAATPRYDHVIGLGYSCQVAWQLELNGMRKCAHPFDWFHTPFASLLNFISHRGENFLEADKITSLGVYPGDPSRLHVIDAVYGIHSYHDFLSTPEFANYADIKAKYDRRIKRFFNVLNTDKKILFVREGGSKKQIEELDKLLQTLYPRLSYTILAVSDTEEYHNNWGHARIKNFYLPQQPGNWQGDGARWSEILSNFSVSFDITRRPPEEQW